MPQHFTDTGELRVVGDNPVMYLYSDSKSDPSTSINLWRRQFFALGFRQCFVLAQRGLGGGEDPWGQQGTLPVASRGDTSPQPPIQERRFAHREGKFHMGYRDACVFECNDPVRDRRDRCELVRLIPGSLAIRRRELENEKPTATTRGLLQSQRFRSHAQRRVDTGSTRHPESERTRAHDDLCSTRRELAAV